jgi:hypothetical protein
VNVVDDKLATDPGNGKNAYLYDSVEIFFDGRGEGSNMDKITTGAMQFYVIPSLIETPSSCKIGNFLYGDYFSVRFSGMKTEKGYVIEGRITPTSYAADKFKFGVNKGRVICFDVAVDDSDDKPGERKTQMVLYGNENNFKDAIRWGRFKLE